MLAHGPGFADHFYRKSTDPIHTDNKYQYAKEVKYSDFKEKPTFNVASVMLDKSFPFLPCCIKMCAYRCKLTTAIHSATLLISHFDKGCKHIQNSNEISSSRPGKKSSHDITDCVRDIQAQPTSGTSKTSFCNETGFNFEIYSKSQIHIRFLATISQIIYTFL